MRTLFITSRVEFHLVGMSYMSDSFFRPSSVCCSCCCLAAVILFLALCVLTLSETLHSCATRIKCSAHVSTKCLSSVFVTARACECSSHCSSRNVQLSPVRATVGARSNAIAFEVLSFSYNLWILLVMVHLEGGSYMSSLIAVLNVSQTNIFHNTNYTLLLSTSLLHLLACLAFVYLSF